VAYVASFWIRDFFSTARDHEAGSVWRNLSLVIPCLFSACGTGSFLLMLWGIWHGILLYCTGSGRSFAANGIRMDRCHGTAISWWLTFSAVCIGYISFARKASIRLCHAEGARLPHGYTHRNLNPSFYMLMLLRGRYFAVIGGSILLDHLAEAARTLRKRAGRLSNWLGILANERWVWITPVIVVLAIYLSVIFQPPRRNRAGDVRAVLEKP